MSLNETDFDRVLEFLEPWGPDLKNGLSNHGPMASEALYTLGKSDMIFPWLEKYGKEFQKKNAPTGRIQPDLWRDYLGKTESYPEWEEFFKQQIRDSSWKQVLSFWAQALAPGICADATHGVIRTGHAARSLSRKESPLRIAELASGLAVWASAYLELPTSLDSNLGLSPEDAILRVPFVPPDKKRFSGSIVSALVGLREFLEFQPVIGYVDFKDDIGKEISRLTEAFSKVFLKNVDDTLSAIVFVHSITSVSALRSILPYMQNSDWKKMLSYAWQTSAGLYSSFGKSRDMQISLDLNKESKEEIIEKAIEHGDEHAIKFAEVCLKEFELNPSPVYLAAATRSRKFLEPLR